MTIQHKHNQIKENKKNFSAALINLIHQFNFLISFFLLSFALPNSLLHAQDSVINFSTITKAQMTTLLEARREEVRSRAYYCRPDTNFAGQFSHARWNCEQADLPIFAGINCLAARIVQDVKGYQYCRDVVLSQGPTGQFWRGQSNIGDNNVSPAAFSKDQALGVLSYAVGNYFYQNPSTTTKNAVTKNMVDWMTYIENNQGGKYLCDKRQMFGNPCDIFQGKGFPDVMYRVFRNTGATGKVDSQWKLVEKLANKEGKFNWNKFRRELLITPSGFQTHLKTINVLIHRSLDKLSSDKDLSDETYRKIARRLFKRDERNPWHYLMYKGVDPILFEKVWKDYCPATLPEGFEVTNGRGGSGYAWQDKKNRRGWENGDGHDCLFLLNMMIADLKGISPLSFESESKRECSESSHHYLGTFSTQNVCEERKDLSMAQCENRGGNLYYLVDQKFLSREEIVASASSDWSRSSFENQYCLIHDKNYYIAHSLKSICPMMRKFEAFWDWENARPYSPTTLNADSSENFSPNLTPICSSIMDKKISHFRCHRRNGSFIYNDENGNRFCIFDKGSFLVKKSLHFMDCPLFHKKVGYKQGWGFPVCKSTFMRKISLSDCTKSTDFAPENGYCLFEKHGYFKGREISYKTEDYPVDTKPAYQTKVVDWFVDETQRKVSKSTLNDDTWSVQGNLSWYTLTDRAKDHFYIRFFYRSKTEANWEELDQATLEERTVEVEYNRGLNLPAAENKDFKGIYQYPYELDVPYSGPETQIKFEVYLEEFDREGQAKLVLSYEQSLLSRGQELFQSALVYPNPSAINNVSMLKLNLAPGIWTEEQQKSHSLEIQFQVLSVGGQILFETRKQEFLFANPLTIDIGELIFSGASSPSLNSGQYFLRSIMFLDGVYAQDYMTGFQLF
ncbi:MAG: hypothetical protein QE271_08685 [Bacteriovoracaceae bacterium]|nr:hypothetical protein [Bacteriovoracaceae bacterium]